MSSTSSVSVSSPVVPPLRLRPGEAYVFGSAFRDVFSSKVDNIIADVLENFFDDGGDAWWMWIQWIAEED